MTAERVTCCSVAARTVKLNCLGVRVKNEAGLLVRLVPCGDTISSCRRHVQVENSHPQFKHSHPQEGWGRLFLPTPYLPSCGDKISSCRRDVQVENSHPQFTNVHPQKSQGRPALESSFLLPLERSLEIPYGKSRPQSGGPVTSPPVRAACAATSLRSRRIAGAAPATVAGSAVRR